MTERLLAVGRAACERREYEVTDPGRPWLPSRLGEPTPDATPFVAGSTAPQVAVEPLALDEVTPTTIVSRLRNNRGNGRFSLFVVDDEPTARAARRILHDPPLVAAEDASGARTFYNGPDRVPLSGGGYAAVRTDSSPSALVWREHGSGDDRSIQLVDRGRDPTRAEGDVRETDGVVVAHLDGVDTLACPDASAFPYTYARDPDDKRFYVRAGTGDAVGRYEGVAAMRANAYVPIPMPLVPEHVFAGVTSVRDEWGVLAAAGSDTGPVLVTADGVARQSL